MLAVGFFGLLFESELKNGYFKSDEKGGIKNVSPA